ncbi:MAG TPA: formate dehydrogenase subunit delta [Dokdonella sp.]|uniref:formate dehydrogenase subunit delta n=1 Tax=Dokdonella sp. TaxID=2291710 RepID=UPI002D80D089|nr:formate dehydrogenase subunit delta [Dokdonella sp.]HET9031764.1 formate dehydrogenase subunit delta [Dokdonella sp.]
MDVQRLVAMANDITRYFVFEPDQEAGVEGVAEHLRKFWTPGMCRQIVEHFNAGGSGLDDLSRSAVARLAADQDMPTE